ncbi:permease prefix domain 1-containing protein [Lysobacter korlensis]|uniref:Permease prefix domain 1-containing protein n=1 Tax=Lysobacter korlensis TaxID=553636 RepID=A0ABV6RRE4_9GAMM
MTTLTDRYVAAVLRGVPEKQRTDVEQELRASVADAVDGMLEQGAEPAAAERSVLTGLGDPDRLAADYSDRPLYLIGPSLFLHYWRLLKVLLAVVVPVSMIAVALAQTLAGSSVGTVFAGAFTTGFNLVVHLGFWVTVVFVILERSGPEARKSLGDWTLDRLPELPARRQTLLDAVGAITWIAVLIALLFVQQFFVFVEGRSMPVLNPELWSFWFPVLVLLLAAEIVLEVVRYRVGRWTVPLAVVNAALNVAVAAIVIGLLRAGSLLNDRFFAAVGWPEGGGADGAIAVVGTVAMVVVAGFSIVDAFIRAYRGRSQTR